MAKPPPSVPAHPPPAPESGPLGALPLRYRRLFIDTMNQDLAALEHALHRRDAIDAALTLHRIRGAFLSLQIPRPDSHADTLEHALRTAGLTPATQAQVRDVILSLRSLLHGA